MSANTKKSTKNNGLTMEGFCEVATSITVSVDGQYENSEPRQFSTGSWGWNVSKKQTLKAGSPIRVIIAGQEHAGMWRQFSSRKWGWNVSAKANLKFGDTIVACQIGVNVIAIGSDSGEPAKGSDCLCQVGVNVIVIGSKEWA